MKVEGMRGFILKCFLATGIGTGIGGPAIYIAVKQAVKDGSIDIEKKVQVGVEKGTEGLEGKVQTGIKQGINQGAEDVEPRVEAIEKRLRVAISEEVEKGTAQIEERVRKGVRQGIREGLGVEKADGQ